LTKGDNNNVDDRGLYGRNIFYIKENKIIGNVMAIKPMAGDLTIILNDYPSTKYLMLGSMLTSVMFSKDPN
jgi:signal peptidase